MDELTVKKLIEIVMKQAKEKGFGTINEGETATVILKVHKAFSNGEKIRIKIVCEIGIFAEGTYLVEGI